jgi:hypothetical protein
MRASILLIALFITSICNSQNFEGKITYQNTYTSKIPNPTSEQFDGMMGTAQEYYIKGDKYKSATNGSFFQWQLYVPTENRLYSKMAVSDTLLWSDGNSNPDEAVSYEIMKNQAEILGYKCDALVVKTKTGKATYYFSKKIKINPELYKDHQYGNFAFFTKQTKSLPLKIEMETPQFTMISTATAVKEIELEESFFSLPVTPIKKSPY